MKTNVGTADRVLRMVAGLVLVGLAASGNAGMWGWLGLVPLATGFAGVCPLYSLLGFNTCSASHRR
ncbi:DUF2892 domain-containing protein [Pseudoduganella ginsengisoli]|uniref:DUF2892 domain-containing protein n=1 Tax=Pseudoduganella ginsengisoli TaxID=1462440 RepID=A0A6L6Q5Q7_9BURK|nr:DUF2892 domain-containing protein [Pseudoduganella ginsengisoli]MTW04608.1 DUF2892 domain-containing protein [Pseudoduganella ginsengisoli]